MTEPNQSKNLDKNLDSSLPGPDLSLPGPDLSLPGPDSSSQSLEPSSPSPDVPSPGPEAHVAFAANTKEHDAAAVSSTEFWQKYYDANDTPWELGKCAPPLEELIASGKYPPGKVIVLGCGRGNEAILLGEHGFDVTAVDFAPSAIDATRKQFEAKSLPVQLLQQDIFELHQLFNKFDYVLEHTCFCAIHPKRRGEYINAAFNLLKPGGRILGLFWLHDRWGGPPYGISTEKLHELFEPRFSFESESKPSTSVEKRANEERLVVLLKK